MVLKLYGTLYSTCSKRVAAVLIEKGVPFKLVPIDLPNKQHKSPEFMEKQPFGQIPYIDDDGFILYESRAIGRYIANKYSNQGAKLIPTDLKALALFEQAVSVEASHFDPLACSAVLEKVFKPMRGLTPDQGVFDASIQQLDKKLDVYDSILSKQTFIAGNEFTLADIFHLPYATMLDVAGSNIMETKPNVSRWFKEISSRPSWMAVTGGVNSTA